MSRAPLPKDCYDVDTAAHFLAVSGLELYRFLRTQNWLHTKTHTRDKRHNQPKQWALKAGYLTTQTRGYAAPYNHKIELPYQVALLTRFGLERIATLMNTTINFPTPAPLTLESAIKIQEQKTSRTLQEEREKAIKELSEMGLYIGKAS